MVRCNKGVTWIALECGFFAKNLIWKVVLVCFPTASPGSAAHMQHSAF
jgi:hypothetical protein